MTNKLKTCFLACLVLLIVSCTESKESSKDTVSELMQIANITNSRTFYFGIIRRGVTWSPEETEESMSIQNAHIENIWRLADSGLLKLAGPFVTEHNSHKIRGLFIYSTETIDEARTLVNTDPAVVAERLTVELYPWINSADLAYDEPVTMRIFRAAFYWYDETQGAPDFNSLYQHHADAFEELGDSASIVLGGPFLTDARPGMPNAFFIFSTDSLSQIERIAADAPGMAEGAISSTVIDFYGPQGLRQ